MFWMLSLGAIAFAIDAWRNPARSHTVLVQRERQEAASEELSHSLGRPPTRAELESALERFIDDELLEREARALGLDQRDPIIRRRMIQKLEQVEVARVDVEQVTRADVEAWVVSRSAQYMLPERVDLEHVFVAQRGRDRPAKMLELRAALDQGADPTSLGDPSTHGGLMRALSQQELTTRFGEDFASAVFLAAREHDALAPSRPSDWFAVPSRLGWHWVRTSELTAPAAAPWDRIAAQATLDLREARREEALEKLRARLRASATVEWEDADAPP